MELNAWVGLCGVILNGVSGMGRVDDIACVDDLPGGCATSFKSMEFEFEWVDWFQRVDDLNG